MIDHSFIRTFSEWGYFFFNKVRTVPLQLMFFMACLAVTMSSCADEKKNVAEPKLSAYGYMTCKVDGKQWKDCQKSMAGDISGVNILWHNKSENRLLTIYGISYCDSSNPKSDIAISIEYFNGKGRYDLSAGNKSGLYHKLFEGIKDIKYMTDGIHTGHIEVTEFDTIKGRITATFSFEAYNWDSSELVTITEGVINHSQFFNN